ncbi:MAG: thioredoxin family protein [Erysipelotrichales bacterium]|nr:thioredoxin family protein [Erysipelotrichales bacterium]
MKRFCKFFMLLSLFSCLGLSSCNDNTDNSNKINFLTGSFDDKYNLGGFEDINQTQLNNLREGNADFIIYAHTLGCSTCASVEKKLEHYIDNYGLTIYRIVYSELDSTDPLRLASKTAPIIGFYKEGKKLDIIPYSSNSDKFDSQSAFNKMFEEYVSLPSCFYITPEALDTKIKNKESFVVHFTRSTCPDCSYLNTHFLDEYMSKNKNKKFYIMECDVIGRRYYVDNDSSTPQVDSVKWQEFKDKYQLSSTTSHEFGYGLGVVPTFQYYKNGVLSASDVYVNDTFSEELISGIEQEGNTVKYKFTVTQSFFEELVNKTFEFETIYHEDSIKSLKSQFKKDCVTSVHDTKLTEFLNKYC